MIKLFTFKSKSADAGVFLLNKELISKTGLIFSLIFLLFSCKNTAETKLIFNETETIKKNVKEREQGITWTQEIEQERLTEYVPRSSAMFGLEVPYTKELFKITKSMQAAVYPNMEDFGSLNLNNLPPLLKEKINKFCEALSLDKHAGAENYFNRKYIFNYVFFVKELEEGWENNFGQTYPELSEDEKLFTKWTLGEPFIGAEITQIPVRFYTSCGIIDVTLFINSNGNNELYQISINRWKKV